MGTNLLPAVVLALGVAFAAPALAATDLPVHEARSAHALVILNADLMASLGFALDAGVPGRRMLDPQYRSVELELGGKLSYVLADGHSVRAIDGGFELPHAFKLHAGARSTRLSLRMSASRTGGVAFELADRAGRAWLTAHYVHQFPGANEIELGNLDLRIAPALAAWLKRPALAGTAVGAMHVKLPHANAAKSLDAVSSCFTPSWPGTPGFDTDVLLANMDTFQAQCAMAGMPPTPLCDGTGNNPNALVKLTPLTILYNLGTSDVPWYTKFNTVQPPGAYPYASIDQHPFLVWNAYRVNAAGQLEQIGRSGMKHAFATSNDGCTCGDSHILAPECSDTYGTFSNDYSPLLSSRREAIASSGIWGRCRSLFDPNCDGVEDAHDIGGFDYRLVVAESELVPALNPGATYYIDAWYVVRDDANIYNTMGWRTFTPAFASGNWNVPLGPAFHNGSVIDEWVGAASATQRNTEVVTARGRLKLAVKVAALGGGQFRYDYALMNFDFGIAITAGAEPNLEVLRNRGFASITVPLPAGTTATATSFHDGDRDAANDWTPTVGGGAVRWSAPAGTSLDWGSLYRFTLVANAPPVGANVSLGVAETSVIADPLVLSIAPGVGDTIFADGLE